MPRTCRCPRSPRRSARRSTSIRRATLTRHYRVFGEALAGLRPLIGYAVKANSNLAVLRAAGPARARADVVSEGEIRRALAAGVPGGADRLLRRRQDRGRDAARAASTASARSTSSASPSWTRSAEVAAGMGAAAPVAIRVNPDVDARTPRQDHHRQGREQVRRRRSRAPARSTPAPRAARDRARRRRPATSAARSPSSPPIEAAFAKVAELTRRCAPRPRRSSGSTSAAASASPTASNEPPPRPSTTARWSGARSASRLRDRVRAGPADRRQRRRAARPRASTARTGEGRDFLVLDAAMNDLIRPAMYDACHDIVPVVEPAAGRPRCPSRRGRPGLRDRRHLRPRPRRCRRWRPATSSPSGPPAPMARSMAASTTAARWSPRCWCTGDDYAVVRPRPSFYEVEEEIIWDSLKGERLEEMRWRRTGSGSPRASGETGESHRDLLELVLRRAAALALESFTRAFWPLGSALRRWQALCSTRRRASCTHQAGQHWASSTRRSARSPPTCSTTAPRPPPTPASPSSSASAGKPTTRAAIPGPPPATAPAGATASSAGSTSSTRSPAPRATRQKRFLIVWNMANRGTITYPIDNLWPGNDYVDIVGSQYYDRCPPAARRRPLRLRGADGRPHLQQQPGRPARLARVRQGQGQALGGARVGHRRAARRLRRARHRQPVLHRARCTSSSGRTPPTSPSRPTSTTPAASDPATARTSCSRPTPANPAPTPAGYLDYVAALQPALGRDVPRRCGAPGRAPAPRAAAAGPPEPPPPPPGQRRRSTGCATSPATTT